MSMDLFRQLLEAQRLAQSNLAEPRAAWSV